MIRFSLKNPLLVNLVLVSVLVLGFLSWKSMPQEMFPAFDRNAIHVKTTFEGASPIEIERQITIPIEDALDSLADIDTVTSTSQEGLSVVRYKLQEGADIDELLREIRTLVDAIENFPTDANTPVVSSQKHYFPVISASVHGNVEMPVLFEQADLLRRELVQLPGVSAVSISGRREWEMWVEVDPHQLATRDVTLAEVRAALRNNLRDTPSGTIRASEGDILLRGIGSETAVNIGAIVVRRNNRGGLLYLRDLANISLQLEEAQTIGRYNGEPSVNLTVSKGADASTFEVRDLVHAALADLTLAPGVEASLFADMSEPIETRINTVQSSGVVALILLLFSLYFLLNFRLALITAIGIPMALMVGVIAMALTGQSINLVSMFAFLVVLGLVVDDSIIISENIYRHIEAGHDPHSAAYIGTHEVLWPLLASIGTTIAAFLPIFSITGTMGKFVAVIPLVVIAALLGSLLEAFLILPSHAAEILRRHEPSRARGRWHDVLDRYQHMLDFCLQRRYLVVATAVGILLVTVAYAMTRMSYTQFGELDRDEFNISIEGPPTSGLAETDALARRVEGILFDVIAEDELESMQTNVGVQILDFSSYTFGSQYLHLSIDLTKAAPEGFIEAWVSPLLTFRFDAAGQRERDTEEIVMAVRAALQGVPGIDRMSITRPQPGPEGNDLEIGVVGPDLNQIRTYAESIQEFLTRLKGVEDVRLNLEPGKTEYQYTLNARGRELGLTQMQIGTAVRTGYQGDKVEYISHGDERIPVRLLYPGTLRRDSSSFGQLPITTEDGVVFLDEVADIEITQGLSTIHHRDSLRMTTVTADIDKETTTPQSITTLLDREFEGVFAAAPRYQMVHLGEKREARRSTADMQRSLITAIVVIFFLLVALFRSLLDPLVVMAAIPLSLIGVIAAHAMAGIHLQFLSLIGLLALAGIVVNDSLILINYAKRLRARGCERVEAIRRAGQARFRAIVLTSVTTFLGVSPLIFFSSGQTRILMPMAISLGVGLLFATVLILIAVPCMYLLADDLREASLRTLHRIHARLTAEPG